MHGREAAEQAAETARQTFEQGVAAETLPSIIVPRAEIEAGLGVLSAFVKAGLVASTGEARRQIKGGGLRVNDALVTDERAALVAGRSRRRRAPRSCRSAARSTSCCAPNRAASRQPRTARQRAIGSIGLSGFVGAGVPFPAASLIAPKILRRKPGARADSGSIVRSGFATEPVIL